MSVLQDVVVVSLDVHIWSGRKKLRPEDLTVSGKLPPKDLVSLGSKKIFDPRALKPFGMVKREADSICLAKGVRFARSYAIPRMEVKDVVTELNTLSAKFGKLVESFLTTFDDVKKSWKEQHPGYEHLIEAELLPKSVIAAKLAFGFQVFCINAVEGDAELDTLMENGKAGNLTVGLVGQLYAEIASQARELVRQSLFGRNEVTQKFLRPLRAMREKLGGLVFLDAAVTPLVDSIDGVITQLPKKGKISGLHLEALRGILALLCDASKMRQHGEMILKGEANGLLRQNDMQAEGNGAGGGEPQEDGTSETEEMLTSIPAKAPGETTSAFVW